MKDHPRAPGALPAFHFFSRLCLLLTLLGLTAAARADTAKIKVDPEAAKNYVALAGGVSPARLSKTIADLSGIHYNVPNQPAGAPVVAHSRMAGTPGGDQARAYVLAQMQQILGTANVHEEAFPVTFPADNGAFIQGAGLTRPLALQPLWPNLVRTSTLPAGGIDGPLIYAGRGDLRAFRGKPVEGSIVLLDFNCGIDWQNAARLGAKAIIFVEPDQIQRGEGELKFLRLPINMPRFWITRGDAALLQSAALTTPNFGVHLACDNPWQTRSTSNIIGTIQGTGPLSSQNIIIESYYDSMSIVPTQAPGAESADGMAAMLELARAFKAHPPKRTVQFVACGAHFLGIQGARTFVDKHMDDWRPVSTLDSFKHSAFHAALPNRTNVLLFSGLDLSSQTGGVGVFYKGSFYDYREDIQSDFSDIGRTMRENAEKIGQVLGFDPAVAFADGVNGANGKGWRNYLPGFFDFDAETATMAGGKGITFATTDDARQKVDTPSDTTATVNVVNLAAQTKVLACEYWHVLNDTNDPNAISPDSAASVMPVPTWPAWTRQGLRLGYSHLHGRVLLFDPKKNFVPDRPIPDTLAVVGCPWTSAIGVRTNLIQATAPGSASFDFVGMPLVISNGQGLRFPPDGKMHLAAFRLHPGDDALGNRGDVDYAPDRGVNGSANYPIEFDLTSDFKETQVIVFPCVATTIYELVNQGALKRVNDITVYDGASDSEPRQYGIERGQGLLTLFSPPDTTTRLKVVAGDGPAIRFLLINSTPEHPTGVGYAVGVPSARLANYNKPPDPNNPDDIVRYGAINNTSLRVAKDMWSLDDFRISNLAKFRIVQLGDKTNPVTFLHDQAAGEIKQALEAYQKKDYELFDAYSREAWANEARVYPQVQQTANDVVQGVIFYLFLLIPFAYFLERLLFGFSDLKRQLAAAFGIFLIVFLIFSQIHPAFSIGSVNPLIILIAFVMLALSVIVSLLVWGKFEEQLKPEEQSLGETNPSCSASGRSGDRVVDAHRTVARPIRQR